LALLIRDLLNPNSATKAVTAGTKVPTRLTKETADSGVLISTGSRQKFVEQSARLITLASKLRDWIIAGEQMSRTVEE
jgi:hypothetical protein